MEPNCFSALPSGLHETRQVRGSPRFPRTKMSEVEEDGGARCEDKLTEVSLPDFKLQKNKESLFSLRSKTGDLSPERWHPTRTVN